MKNGITIASYGINLINRIINCPYLYKDAPIYDGELTSMYDLIENKDSPSPDNNLMNSSLTKEIERLFSSLTRRDSDILRRYYGLNGFLPESLEVIADEFGLSCERVRQIIKNAKKELKKQHQSRRLLDEYC